MEEEDAEDSREEVGEDVGKKDWEWGWEEGVGAETVKTMVLPPTLRISVLTEVSTTTDGEGAPTFGGEVWAFGGGWSDGGEIGRVVVWAGGVVAGC